MGLVSLWSIRRNRPTTDIKRDVAAMEAALPETLSMSEHSVNIDSGSYLTAGVNAVSNICSGMRPQMGFTIERNPQPGLADQMTARMASARS